MSFRIWDRLTEIGGSFLHMIVKLDLTRQQWVYVGIGVLILGAVCMRGFGSRSNY